MKWLVGFLLALFNVVFAGTGHLNVSTKLSKHISQNIQSNWCLNGHLNGGKFDPKIEVVSYEYHSKKSLNKAEIRKLYVDVVEYTLFVYNTSLKLRDKLSNYPFIHNNVEIYIIFDPNENDIGKIKYVNGLRNKVFYIYSIEDHSYKSEVETFEEAYFKVYGRAWDPFKYGDCQKSECP